MRIIKICFNLTILLVCGIVLSFAGTYLYLGAQLPTISTLTNYQTQTPLRIYSSDYKLIAEFGDKRSLPVKYEQIPSTFINALLAAEDSNFYQHHGINTTSILRAASEIVKTGKIKSGGSTITMQVAKNYLLSSERSFTRKIKEILLSIQIERELSKEQIFELYVNKIYLGNHAYGIAAAAEVYYGKTLEQLNIAEAATIAGLPKAPSSFNPLVNPKRSLERRNWILERMLKLNFIDLNQYQVAVNTPETAKYYQVDTELYAPYVAENARLEAFEQYGEDVYNLGLDVITNIDSKAQQSANLAIFNGLIQYDQKHGFRNPANVPTENWQEVLDDAIKVNQLIIPVIINELSNNQFSAITQDKNIIKGSTTDPKWLNLAEYYPHLKIGDLIYISQNNDDKKSVLPRLPEVQAALLTLNPNDGKILAMVGGLSFEQSTYNRVTQAKRQTGSVFKPFIYSAALDKKYTASSIINDSPILLENDVDIEWRPKNSTNNFLGPIRLREALYRSRNLVSIRLLNSIGINYARNYLTNFGFDITQLPSNLSLSLGSASLTPLEVTTGFSVFANGGYKINPYLISQIKQRSTNNILWQHEQQPAKLAIDPRTAFIIHSILKDVVNRGTAFKVKQLGRSDLAGKTGTTNDSIDTWFIGYNSSYITTVWTGFDKPKSLGANEFGSTFALPIWMEHMKNVLQDVPMQQVARPKGLITLNIDTTTGNLATAKSTSVYSEYFKAENLPNNNYVESEINSNNTNNHQNIETDKNIEADDINDIF